MEVGFIAEIPTLGVIGDGKTQLEAIIDAREVAYDYLSILIEDGKEFPPADLYNQEKETYTDKLLEKSNDGTNTLNVCTEIKQMIIYTINHLIDDYKKNICEIMHCRKVLSLETFYDISRCSEQVIDFISKYKDISIFDFYKEIFNDSITSSFIGDKSIKISFELDTAENRVLIVFKHDKDPIEIISSIHNKICKLISNQLVNSGFNDLYKYIEYNNYLSIILSDNEELMSDINYVVNIADLDEMLNNAFRFICITIDDNQTLLDTLNILSYEFRKYSNEYGKIIYNFTINKVQK